MPQPGDQYPDDAAEQQFQRVQAGWLVEDRRGDRRGYSDRNAGTGHRVEPGGGQFDPLVVDGIGHAELCPLYCRVRGADRRPPLSSAPLPRRARTDSVIGSADSIGSFAGFSATAGFSGISRTAGILLLA